MFIRKAIIVAVCCLLITSVLYGQTKIVTLRNEGGGIYRITGTLKKVEGGYEITHGLIVTTVADDQVVSIVDVITPEDEYEMRKKRIDSNSAEDRFALGEWAFKKGLNALAVEELKMALELDAEHEKAALLLDQVKLLLKEAAERAESEVTTKSAVSPGARKKMITDRDLNRVRLAEVIPGERVSVTFQNDVLDRFIDSMRTSDEFREDPDGFERNFRGLSSSDKLSYILSKIGPNNWALKDDIIVKSDPAVIKKFREMVWPLVSRSCASATCHGAAKGKGRLKLFSVATNDTIGMYTNFLILDMFISGSNRMIDRDRVNESLLLEYGLPTKEAKRRHPGEVPAVFKNVKDGKYITIRQWIDSLVGPPHPHYGTDYKPPFGPKIDMFDPLEVRPKKPDKPTTEPAETDTKKKIRPI